MFSLSGLHLSIIVITITFPVTISSIIMKSQGSDKKSITNHTPSKGVTPSTVFDDVDNADNHVTSDIIQESSNFFTDIDAPSSHYTSRTFDTPEYEPLFDAGFPNLPYFPDFGEIFRIPRTTTTPRPLFRFPDYVRDVFPERPSSIDSIKHVKPGNGNSETRATSVTGGRRPSRRPPRPASSGTKSKLAKQNQSEPKEKTKPIKSKSPGKARDYPKIFRFTADRVNLADFDMRKKMNSNYLTLAKGDDLDSNKIQRNKFLILHGGVFEIERSGSGGLYGASSEIEPVVETLESEPEFGLRTEKLKSDLRNYYKT